MALINSYLRDTSSYKRIPLEKQPPHFSSAVTRSYNCNPTPAIYSLILSVAPLQQEAISFKTISLNYHLGAEFIKHTIRGVAQFNLKTMFTYSGQELTGDGVQGS